MRRAPRIPARPSLPGAPSAVRPATRPSPATPSLLRRGVVLLAMLLLASAGAAGTAAALLREPAPVTGTAGQWLDLDGVRLRLDRTVVEQAVAHTAPGSTSGASTTGADQPAPGTHRVSLEVTLQAVSRAVRHAPGDFRLGAPGVAGAAPLRWRMGEGELQPGRSVSARLTFQVPIAAERLVLSWGAARVSVDGAAGAAAEHGPAAAGGHSGPAADAPGRGSAPDHHAGQSRVIPHDD